MKTIIQTILLVLISSFAYTQDLPGEWTGVLNVQGSQFRLVFHIGKMVKPETGYTATMDSPDQNANGIAVTTVTFGNPDVKFEISAIGMKYEGKLTNNQITGTWLQAGQSFPLILSKSENKPVERSK